jgi:hypothetical protein
MCIVYAHIFLCILLGIDPITPLSICYKWRYGVPEMRRDIDSAYELSRVGPESWCLGCQVKAASTSQTAKGRQMSDENNSQPRPYKRSWY